MDLLIVNKLVSCRENQPTERSPEMDELLLRKVRVHDVIFGEKTEVIGHVLRINREELSDTSWRILISNRWR